MQTLHKNISDTLQSYVQSISLASNGMINSEKLSGKFNYHTAKESVEVEEEEDDISIHIPITEMPKSPVIFPHGSQIVEVNLQAKQLIGIIEDTCKSPAVFTKELPMVQEKRRPGRPPKPLSPKSPITKPATSKGTIPQKLLNIGIAEPDQLERTRRIENLLQVMPFFLFSSCDWLCYDEPIFCQVTHGVVRIGHIKEHLITENSSGTFVRDAVTGDLFTSPENWYDTIVRTTPISHDATDTQISARTKMWIPRLNTNIQQLVTMYMQCWRNYQEITKSMEIPCFRNDIDIAKQNGFLTRNQLIEMFEHFSQQPKVDSKYTEFQTLVARNAYLEYKMEMYQLALVARDFDENTKFQKFIWEALSKRNYRTANAGTVVDKALSFFMKDREERRAVFESKNKH